MACIRHVGLLRLTIWICGLRVPDLRCTDGCSALGRDTLKLGPGSKNLKSQPPQKCNNDHIPQPGFNDGVLKQANWWQAHHLAISGQQACLSAGLAISEAFSFTLKPAAPHVCKVNVRVG